LIFLVDPDEKRLLQVVPASSKHSAHLKLCQLSTSFANIRWPNDQFTEIISIGFAAPIVKRWSIDPQI